MTKFETAIDVEGGKRLGEGGGIKETTKGTKSNAGACLHGTHCNEFTALLHSNQRFLRDFRAFLPLLELAPLHDH